METTSFSVVTGLLPWKQHLLVLLLQQFLAGQGILNYCYDNIMDFTD